MGGSSTIALIRHYHLSQFTFDTLVEQQLQDLHHIINYYGYDVSTTTYWYFDDCLIKLTGYDKDDQLVLTEFEFSRAQPMHYQICSFQDLVNRYLDYIRQI